jgi:PAS domain S-box-containing protein
MEYPRDMPDHTQTQAPATTLAESEILGASILIVDDQPANVELLEAMLAASGYSRVSSTTNPREVCARHREHNFDLILLDLQMPGMDGFEVMEGLKELEAAYLPVLVLTAQPSQKLRALQAGAKDFVTKPFDVLEVQTRIRNMLEVRLLYKRIEANNRQLEQTVQERTGELRESEARFRSLVELASDWYWEQDENGRFTKVSGPALEMLGLGDPDAAEAGQAPRWNVRERALLDEKLATRKPFIDFVYSRVNADGSEQFLQTSGEPMFDPTGRFTGYRGIGMDVTGRMRPEGAGADGLDQFRQAMAASTQAVFLVDQASLRFIDVNEAACRLAGRSRAELLATPPGAVQALSGEA